MWVGLALLLLSETEIGQSRAGGETCYESTLLTCVRICVCEHIQVHMCLVPS